MKVIDGETGKAYRTLKELLEANPPEPELTPEEKKLVAKHLKKWMALHPKVILVDELGEIVEQDDLDDYGEITRRTR
jgi:hypothetical protein